MNCPFCDRQISHTEYKHRDSVSYYADCNCVETPLFSTKREAYNFIYNFLAVKLLNELLGKGVDLRIFRDGKVYAEFGYDGFPREFFEDSLFECLVKIYEVAMKK